MDKIDAHYAPPRELCEPKFLECEDEPFTREEAVELLKLLIGFPLSFALLVGPLIGIGLYIQEVEYGGLEGLEMPEPPKETKKQKKLKKMKHPKTLETTPIKVDSLSGERLPLPKTFRKSHLSKESFKQITPRRIHKVQHF